MKAEGWRSMWNRFHYFRNGESLCGKFTVQIIGGGEPRKPWPLELPSGPWPPCADCQGKLAESLGLEPRSL